MKYLQNPDSRHFYEKLLETNNVLGTNDGPDIEIDYEDNSEGWDA